MVKAILYEEQARFLGADPYERSQERRGHHNGPKPRTIKARMGRIGFEVLQVRGAEGPFRPLVCPPNPAPL
jgi:transposase-like protein